MNPFGVSNVSFFLCKSLHKSPITIKGSHFSPLLWRELNKCFEEKLNTAYGINCNGRRNLLVGLIRDRLHGESHPETTITLLTCDDHCDVSDHGGQGGLAMCTWLIMPALMKCCLSPSCCHLWVGGGASGPGVVNFKMREREAKSCKSRRVWQRPGLDKQSFSLQLGGARGPALHSLPSFRNRQTFSILVSVYMLLCPSLN